MMQAEMAELVRENGLDFFRGKTREQGVEEHDSLGAAESGEERVAMARSARAVHHEETFVREAAARKQRLDRRARGTFGQRRKFVEQRRDNRRVERQHQ